MEKNLNFSLLLDYYGGLLKGKQRDIVDYYYNDDLSLAEIADNLNITRQGVRDFLKRTEQALLEYEQILGLYSKAQNAQECLESINNSIKQLHSVYNNPKASVLLDKIEGSAHSMCE